MNIEVIALSLISTIALALLFTSFVSYEVLHNRRFARRVREYSDRQTARSAKKVKKYTILSIAMLRRGGGVVEHDLVDPITEPVTKVSERYHILKTGEIKIRKKPLSRISPYMQYLFKRKQ